MQITSHNSITEYLTEYASGRATKNVRTGDLRQFLSKRASALRVLLSRPKRHRGLTMYPKKILKSQQTEQRSYKPNDIELLEVYE